MLVGGLEMKEINDLLREEKDIQSIIECIKNEMIELYVSGLSGPAKRLFMLIIQQSINRPILLVTHQLHQAQQLYNDLFELVDHKSVYLYPVNEITASEIAT